MKSLILSVGDLRDIILHVGLKAIMQEMIDRLTLGLEAFDEDRDVIRTRDGFHYAHPNIGLLEWMPSMKKGESVTIKVVAYHPDNPQQWSLPTIVSTVSAYDASMGHLIGLIDGTFLTAIRTAAASAVASRIMASPKSKTLGMIGCGVQAVSHLHAMFSVFEWRRENCPRHAYRYVCES